MSLIPPTTSVQSELPGELCELLEGLTLHEAPLLDSLIVGRDAFNEQLREPGRRPLTELRAAPGPNAVAHGKDRL